MTLTLIFLVIFVHWVADFVFQTHWQATNKSTNNWALFQHVGSYTITWMVVIWLSVGWYGYGILWFIPITFVSHFITDYFTSRLNSYLWKKGDIHNFFVSIGFDQVLHYIQLFLTIHLLIN